MTCFEFRFFIYCRRAGRPAPDQRYEEAWQHRRDCPTCRRWRKRALRRRPQTEGSAP